MGQGAPQSDKSLMQRRRGHLVAYMNPIVNQELQKGMSIDQM